MWISDVHAILQCSLGGIELLGCMIYGTTLPLQAYYSTDSPKCLVNGEFLYRFNMITYTDWGFQHRSDLGKNRLLCGQAIAWLVIGEQNLTGLWMYTWRQCKAPREPMYCINLDFYWDDLISRSRVALVYSLKSGLVYNKSHITLCLISLVSGAQLNIVRVS